MKLTDREWKPFLIGDLFSIKKGKRLTAENQSPGLTPFLGAIDSNNGVTNYIINEPIHEGNTITVNYNGSVGEAFYQPEPFWASDDVNVLYAKDPIKTLLNTSTALFVCTVIKTHKYRWSYGRKWSMESMAKSVIHLPVGADGSPDWAFMETYIKSLHHKPIATKNSHQKTKLNFSSWKPFKLDQLFKIVKGKPRAKEDQTDGATPFISATEFDNGMSDRIGQGPIFHGNTITVSCNGSVGEAFYQPFDYWASGDVSVLQPLHEGFNKYSGLFISTILRQEKHKYSYGRKWSFAGMCNTEILLPARPDGEPDWQYMEDYIKSLPYGDRI